MECWDEGLGSGHGTPVPDPAGNQQTAGKWTDCPAWPFPTYQWTPAPDKKLTEVLDYEDVEENNLGVPDPEIAQAVAHIPQADAFADVEMQESQPPPEVSRSGYDVNLVC